MIKKIKEIWSKIEDIYNCYGKEEHILTKMGVYDRENFCMHCYCGRVIGEISKERGENVFIDTKKEEIINIEQNPPSEIIVNNK